MKKYKPFFKYLEKFKYTMKIVFSGITLKILITGGAGALGSELAKTLSKKGFEVRIFDLPNVDFYKVQSLERTEIFKGDITKYSEVREAVSGVDVVLHLAAILPPSSEFNKDRTMKINYGGTMNIVNALKLEAKRPLLVFTSSVCVYGIPSNAKQLISEEHATIGTDNYSESKVLCEQIIRNSGVRYVILRISGISVADFFEFPDVLQFSSDQRIEFVSREDVVIAFVSCIEKKEALWGVFNIAGGKTWQMTGKEYISKVCEIMEMPLADVKFATKSTWFSWYDTSKGQAILNYQRTTFDRFLLDFRVAIDRAYGRSGLS